MFPVRLSVVTYNLWNTERWPAREPALQQFVELFRPDVICVQELRTETQACLDAAMPHHTRVHDVLPGWTCEGNIYWHGALLEEVEHGQRDLAVRPASNHVEQRIGHNGAPMGVLEEERLNTTRNSWGDLSTVGHSGGGITANFPSSF